MSPAIKWTHQKKCTELKQCVMKLQYKSYVEQHQQTKRNARDGHSKHYTLTPF